MSTSARPSVPSATARRPRDDRPIRRRAAAVVLVVPAACAVAAQLVSPTYGVIDTAAALDAIAAAPGRQTAALLLSVAAFLTLVPAFLAAARLARRRRPLLAASAAAVNLVAYLGLGLAFSAYEPLLAVAAARPVDERPSLVAYLDAVVSSGVFNLSTGLFVIGHVVGAVLAGLALRGTIPTWAWVALAVSQPAHFVSFVVLQNAVLDAASWGLTAVALTVCAVTVLRTPDDEWDLPPLDRGRPAPSTV